MDDSSDCELSAVCSGLCYHFAMGRKTVSAIVCALLTTPSFAFAFPFGGQINQIIFCYNDAIYANVGPPRGGPFIWTPSTRTYRFGPPMRSGQWLLGLAAPPYYCIVSKQPIIVWSGILMTMEGSSGAAAPAYSPRNTSSSALNGLMGSGATNGSSGANTTPTNAIRILVSEVYPYPDSNHGGSGAHWIEFYNATLSEIDLTRWVVKTASTTLALPSGTKIAPHGYLLLTADASLKSHWQIAATVPVVVSSSFSSGFRAAGDAVYLEGDDGTLIDAVSWGDNTKVLSPAAELPTLGHALIRTTLARDTDSKQDWVDTSAPTPGR